ncbi:hypothetical protein EX30DRAFT_188038 [Ascodesmis nigricans]|uniref:Uncharacterized protein n=1 Tax=Ascodesmis nigricans TaxID=341454 RepID=A0A4S2N0A0_9PEZI|nr:hypothetical protein EX30DRAFT_188038 [Ascodesmis nigricans]
MSCLQLLGIIMGSGPSGWVDGQQPFLSVSQYLRMACQVHEQDSHFHPYDLGRYDLYTNDWPRVSISPINLLISGQSSDIARAPCFLTTQWR